MSSKTQVAAKPAKPKSRAVELTVAIQATGTVSDTFVIRTVRALLNRHADELDGLKVRSIKAAKPAG